MMVVVVMSADIKTVIDLQVKQIGNKEFQTFFFFQVEKFSPFFFYKCSPLILSPLL